MTCDDVREHLAEHLLGSLPEAEEADVRAHLRGCMVCRQELAALEEGMRTFARAAHQAEPPVALKERVLGVLRQEQAETAPARRPLPGRPLQWAAAAVIALLAGALAWTGVAASNWHDEAAKYGQFLGALGGRDVRVGVLQQRGEQHVEGSIVMYDSDKGQSWVLLLVQAPGETGQAQVTVTGSKGQIELHPLQFDGSGEASTWLVTRSDLSRFDRVRIVDASGQLLATGHVAHE